MRLRRSPPDNSRDDHDAERDPTPSAPSRAGDPLSVNCVSARNRIFVRGEFVSQRRIAKAAGILELLLNDARVCLCRFHREATIRVPFAFDSKEG